MAADKCPDLLGVEQGTTGHFGPEIIIWDQFVVHQAVDTVRLHNSTLVQLILIGCSCGCKKRDERSFYRLGEGFPLRSGSGSDAESLH